jgi:DnaJ-class molecular chaperone
MHKLDKRIVDLTLVMGLLPKQVIEVKNQGNMMHDGLRGDITFNVDVDMTDDVFMLISPNSLDLKCFCTISLKEALLGFDNRILCTHMDGRVLITSHPIGVPIEQNSVQCIVGEGMPDPKNPHRRGNLEIQFKVEFPERVYPTDDIVKAVERFFSPQPPSPPVVHQPPPAVPQPNTAVHQAPPVVNRPPPVVNQPPPKAAIPTKSPLNDQTNESSKRKNDPSTEQFVLPPRVIRKKNRNTGKEAAPDPVFTKRNYEPINDDERFQPRRRFGDLEKSKVTPTTQRTPEVIVIDDDDDEVTNISNSNYD